MTQWTDSGYETDTCVLQVDPRRRIPSVPPRFNQSKRRIAFPPWSLPSVRGYRHLSTTLTNQSSLWSRACQNAARGTSPNVIGPMVSRAAEDWRCSMRYITNMIGPVLFAGILVHNTAHTTHVVSFDQSGAVQLQYRFLQLDWSCPARDVFGFFFRSCCIGCTKQAWHVHFVKNEFREISLGEPQKWFFGGIWGGGEFKSKMILWGILRWIWQLHVVQY